MQFYGEKRILIVNNILLKLNISPETIVQKKHGKIPCMTALHVVTRLIEAGNNLTILEVFPGINKATLTKILRNIFGNQSLTGSKTWYLHALSVVDMAFCTNCDKPTTLIGYSISSRACADCVKIKNAEYYQNNKAVFVKAKLKRISSLKQATPSWANIPAMNEFYANCPEGYEVDHWAPLQSDKVCGLHTLENLQYLTIADNRAKYNKFNT